MRGQGYIDTLVTFERESGMYLKVYNRQTVFLKQLLVEGKFRQAESFIDCLESRLGEQVTVCKMGIKKQLFLELIQNKVFSPFSNISDQIEPPNWSFWGCLTPLCLQFYLKF